MDLDLTSSPPRADCRAPPADPGLPLARHATLALRLPRGSCIEVAAGRIWLTEPGDADDHFIAAGGRHLVRRGGRVVLEGDSAVPARVRVRRP